MQMAGEYFLIDNLDVVGSSPPCKSSGTDKLLFRGRMRSAQKPAEMFLQKGVQASHRDDSTSKVCCPIVQDNGDYTFPPLIFVLLLLASSEVNQRH